MNINRRSLSLIVLPAFIFKVAFPQSLPVPEVVDVGIDFEAPNTPDDEKKNGDELYPTCPCFDRSDLAFYQQEIIRNKADLVLPKSCTDDFEADAVSLVMKYIEREYIVTEQQELPGTATASVSTINPPYGADPKMFLKGWTVEASPDVDQGSCFKLPFNIFGPYPLENIRTCQMFIRDACTLLKRAMCPCYKLDDIMTLKEKIETDPNFILDVDKSCKDPNDNNGLPYGIYKKDVEIVISETSQNDRMHIYNLGEKKTYPSLIFEDKLKLGIGTENGAPVCYDGSDAVYPDLDFLQLTHCRSLMEYLCDSLELGQGPPDENGSGDVTGREDDDEDYRKNGNDKLTCEYLTRDERRRKRNCRKYDIITGKRVFEHCRKSCFAQSCIDREDFFFNGQKDKGCEWVAQNKEYCVDGDVARNCVVACGTECCKDDPNFKFKRNGVRGLSCNSIKSVNPEGFCDQKKVANKCKMSCLKCPIQPRLQTP